MTERMTAAWDYAKGQIKKAQQRQKIQHDKHSKDPGFKARWETEYLSACLPQDMENLTSFPSHLRVHFVSHQ